MPDHYIFLRIYFDFSPVAEKAYVKVISLYQHIIICEELTTCVR